jgi:hypothetical protein
MLCIPAPLAAALQVQQESLREVSVADGRLLQVPYVGPLRVDFEGRWNQARQRLEADPRSLHLPHALV